jgi:hypothetical protein
MKAIATKLFLISLLLFINEYSLFAKNEYISMELHKIKITDNIIDSLISKVICDNKEMLKEKDCFLLVGMIQAENDTNYVNIIIYKKSKFIIDDSSSILGYSQIEEQIVLVLGKCLWGKMQLLNDKSKFSFKCKKIYKHGTIPPPPSMYNPPNYIFLYE